MFECCPEKSNLDNSFKEAPINPPRVSQHFGTREVTHNKVLSQCAQGPTLLEPTSTLRKQDKTRSPSAGEFKSDRFF